jgi:methionyl-tRNA formyltransferase
MSGYAIPIGLAISGIKGLNILNEALRNKHIRVKLAFFNSKNNIAYGEMKELCEDKKISVIETNKIESHTNAIMTNGIKVFFVIGWRFKLVPRHFNFLDYGVIVFHDSLLPKYRGFSPLFWALINGEKKAGASAFYIDDDIDSGDIIMQKEFSIHPRDDIVSLTERVIESYALIFDRIVALLVAGKQLPRAAQKHDDATYCIWRSPEDARINWRENVNTIHNLIRASKEPFYLPYTLFNGKKMFILSAEISQYRRYVGSTPGKVENIRAHDGVYVLAKDGMIKLKKVRFEDGQVRDAWDVIKNITVMFE